MSWHVYPAAAAAAVRRSVRPCRHGTKRVLFSRHSLHVGGTQVAHPTGGGPWTYSLPNDIYTKRKREIWVSLSRRAQIPLSTRTKVHGSAPLHHTTNLHYTTTRYSTTDLPTTATKIPYVSNQGCFVFLAVPCSYPRHTVYLTTIMPPCKEEGRRRQARQQYCILHTLPY